MELIRPVTTDQLDIIRDLFREYEAFLNVDLCFQGFEKELAELPGKYGPPDGELILAVDDGKPAGCVAVRKLELGLCEMKRLYVVPAYRGLGLGRLLAEAVIEKSRELGYSNMCLDTLESLTSAITLYESLGFRQRTAYYDNPLPGVVYLELDL